MDDDVSLVSSCVARMIYEFGAVQLFTYLLGLDKTSCLTDSMFSKLLERRGRPLRRLPSLVQSS